MPNEMRHPVTLQRVDLDPPSEVEILHFKYESPKKGFYPSHRSEGLFFRKGTTVNFDTLFGTFFEADWYGYTALDNVVLELTIVGDFAATVYRKTFNNDVYIVGRADSGQGETVHIRFSKSKTLPPVPARIWPVIDALSDITVRSVAWITDDEPVQKDVALGVCFATFNRLPYLKRVVNDLLANDESFGCIEKIILINQGEPFALDVLIEEANREKAGIIRLIEQDNFGGCGGFTRGIIESMGDDDLTHVLLCDDDIAFEAHSIVRLTSFLKFCHDDVAVGGQMLDILRPNFLYESGAVLREKDLTSQPLGHNMFLGNHETLDYLISQSRVDYNGWWYFAFSKKIVERIKLPIPCFIRGDDIEYGIRLKKHDIHTVVLPGVVVWHEPFYMKLGGWHYYYEIKNRLILQALHYTGRVIKKDLNSILKIFLRDLLTCRYYTAKLAILAMEDFLAGPEVSMTCDPQKLAEVREFAKEYGPNRVMGDYVPVAECPERRRRKARIFGGIGLREVRAFLYDLLPVMPHKVRKRCFIPAHRFNIAQTMGLRQFIVREMDQKTFIEFVRSRRKFWSLLRDFYTVYFRMKREYPKLVNEYQEQAVAYTSVEHWRSLLELPTDPSHLGNRVQN